MCLFGNSAVAVSTHSRLKAAGPMCIRQYNMGPVSTHSRLKAAGLDKTKNTYASQKFQHTAA